MKEIRTEEELDKAVSEGTLYEDPDDEPDYPLPEDTGDKDIDEFNKWLNSTDAEEPPKERTIEI